MTPSLIYCPNCRLSQENGNLGSNKRDAITMGSVTSEGYVIIKRTLGKMTMIMATTYSLICDCGYFIRVSNGKITHDALHGTYVDI